MAASLPIPALPEMNETFTQGKRSVDPFRLEQRAAATSRWYEASSVGFGRRVSLQPGMGATGATREPQPALNRPAPLCRRVALCIRPVERKEPRRLLRTARGFSFHTSSRRTMPSYGVNEACLAEDIRRLTSPMARRSRYCESVTPLCLDHRYNCEKRKG